MKSAIIAILVVIILALGGWGLYNFGKSNTNTTNGNNQPSNSSSSNQSSSQNQSTSQNATSVRMTNMLFTPSQVTINKGETVTWTNDDTTAHTVIADNGNGPNSETIQPGSTYSYTFEQTGSYQYHCSLHSAMHGTVVVR